MTPSSCISAVNPALLHWFKAMFCANTLSLEMSCACTAALHRWSKTVTTCLISCWNVLQTSCYESLASIVPNEKENQQLRSNFTTNVPKRANFNVSKASMQNKSQRCTVWEFEGVYKQKWSVYSIICIRNSYVFFFSPLVYNYLSRRVAMFW